MTKKTTSISTPPSYPLTNLRILIELDHMDWIRHAFGQQICTDYTRHMQTALIHQMGPNSRIEQSSYDKIWVSNTVLPPPALVDLAQHLSFNLNALTYQAGDQIISGAASVSIFAHEL